MITWIDKPAWVLVEVDHARREVFLSDGAVKRRQFRVDDEAAIDAAELDPYVPGLDATPNMLEAWERFCALMGRDR